MTTNMRTTFEAFIDMVIDRIIQITDYFILEKKITLSESFLFALAATRTLWYIAFGVHNANYDMVLSNLVWVLIFGVLTSLHLAAFLLSWPMFRFYVVAGYAFVWCFLSILAALSGSNSPAFAGLTVMTALSLFIAVRLYREARHA